MGRRITFRGRGCAATKNMVWGSVEVPEAYFDPMSDPEEKSVSIVEPRVKFVKGYLTGGVSNNGVECGEGTEYPLKVTVDEMFEIFYQVKRAHLLSGQLSSQVPNDEEFYEEGTNTLSINIVVPENPCNFTGRYIVDEDGAFYDYTFGYVVEKTENFPASWLPYYSNSYEVPENSGNEYLEVADDPIVLWISWDEFYGQNQLENAFNANITAYDIGIISDQIEAGYTVEPSYDAFGESYLVFSIYQEVAWIDKDGSGDPYSFGNELYIKSNFSASTFHTSNSIEVSSFKDDLYNPESISIKLVLELKNSTVQIPLFAAYYPDQVYTGEDIIIKACEWWEYE